MVRSFASIMGVLGMIVLLVRAILHGSSLDATAPMAIMGMMVLAVVGAIVGTIAKWTVDDSVRLQLKQDIEAMSDSDIE